jgi:glycine betaine/proline transport system permease protein
LALALTATIISLIFGVPLGIWFTQQLCERQRRRYNFTIQSIPALPDPCAVLFGLGRVRARSPIFAMPLVVRLTSLGIRQSAPSRWRAGNTLVCCLQLLFKVTVTIALPDGGS